MKLSRLAIAAVALLTALTAVPTFAADRTFELTGWVSWIDTDSSGTFNSSSPNQAFDVSFDAKQGFGAAANTFWSPRISTEFSASEVKTDVRTRVRPSGPAAGTIGNARMVPLTATLQFHFAPSGTIDPYIGAGAAYVLFNDVNDINDANNAGLDQIRLKDDVGLVLNAGIGFALGRNLALVADVKYVPLKSSATAVFANSANSRQDIKVNPVIASAGLQLRF